MRFMVLVPASQESEAGVLPDEKLLAERASSMPSYGQGGPRPAGSAMTTSDIHRTIDAVWRIESAKPIAGLVRIVRDVGLAENLAQAALGTAPGR